MIKLYYLNRLKLFYILSKLETKFKRIREKKKRE
jgi:hypothetical protein